MSKIAAQLKKGVLEIIILSLLKKNRMYGYEIIQALEEISDGYYTLKEGSLYPVLYRLEDKGYITNEIVYEESKRAIPRKYYTLTKEGKQMTEEFIIEWERFSEVTNRIISR